MNRQELIELLEKNRQEGRVTFDTGTELRSAPIDEFIEQPAEGMLYDLNRDMATCMTFIDKPTWINNYACCVVIKALKKRIEELEEKKKMVKLSFVPTHSTGSDETSPYDVTLDRKCTVREFIDAVLQRREWGRVEIKNGSRMEYRNSDIISSCMTDDDMESLIDKVRAVGGWSNMNYYLEIK